MKIIHALALCLALAPSPVLALGAAFGGDATQVSIAGVMYEYMEYGQSLRTPHQSSGNGVCLGSIWTPAGTGQFNTTQPQSPNQGFMLNNVGAPDIGGSQSFQPTQVTAILPVVDCGPIGYVGSKQSNGQVLSPTEINMLQTLDAGAGRGTIYRMALTAGIGGRTILELSQPTAGEPCNATDSGAQCYCYSAGQSGLSGGTNGAACIFAFNQAFVGPTSMAGEGCAQALLLGSSCAVNAVDWSQGGADLNTSQSAYASLLSALPGNIQSAIKTTTGQGSTPDFLLQQNPSHVGDSVVGPWKADVAFCDANVGAGTHIHCVGPYYQFRVFGATTFTFPGAAVHSGDSGFITFHISGSDVTITTPATANGTGAYTTTVANNINGNSTMIADCIYALDQPGVPQLLVFQRVDPGCPFPYTITTTGTTIG